MDLNGILHRISDNWATLALLLIFVGVVLFVFRPGARRAQRKAAESILDNEDRPLPDKADDEADDRRK